MKLLCLCNTTIDQTITDQALEQVKADYATVGVPVSWKYEWRDFKDVKWVNYNPTLYDSLGFNFSYLTRETKKVRSEHGETFDCVIFIVHPDHWKNGKDATAGWNLGEFFNGYQVQMVEYLITPTYLPETLYHIFSMELYHGINDLILKETGVRIAKTVGVKDWDEDVVHEKKDGRFTFNYRPSMMTLGSLLRTTFQKKRAREVKEITLKVLLEKIVVLLREVILLRGKKPVAVELDHL